MISTYPHSTENDGKRWIGSLLSQKLGGANPAPTGRVAGTTLCPPNRGRVVDTDHVRGTRSSSVARSSTIVLLYSLHNKKKMAESKSKVDASTWNITLGGTRIDLEKVQLTNEAAISSLTGASGLSRRTVIGIGAALLATLVVTGATVGIVVAVGGNGTTAEGSCYATGWVGDGRFNTLNYSNVVGSVPKNAWCFAITKDGFPWRTGDHINNADWKPWTVVPVNDELDGKDGGRPDQCENFYNSYSINGTDPNWDKGCYDTKTCQEATSDCTCNVITLCTLNEANPSQCKPTKDTNDKVIFQVCNGDPIAIAATNITEMEEW